MNESWGKFYAKTFTGSMRGKGGHVISLMAYCVANAVPPDGELELNIELVSFLIGEPEDRMREALKILTEPDPRSRTKDCDGRRLIQLGEYQYRLVNWLAHREGEDTEAKKAYWKKKQAEYRAKKKSKGMGAVESHHEKGVNNGTICHECGQPFIDGKCSLGCDRDPEI